MARPKTNVEVVEQFMKHTDKLSAIFALHAINVFVDSTLSSPRPTETSGREIINPLAWYDAAAELRKAVSPVLSVDTTTDVITFMQFCKQGAMGQVMVIHAIKSLAMEVEQFSKDQADFPAIFPPQWFSIATEFLASVDR